VPEVFAQLRAETYRHYAWPKAFAGVFDRNGLAVGVITAVSLALVMVLCFLLVEPAALFGAHAGDFYAVIPHNVMVVSFGLASLYVLVALVMGFRAFWASTGEALGDFVKPEAFWQGVGDTFRMRYLEGGGDGCTYPGEAPSHARRWFHHLTFYGFLLCFAATSVATVYHYGFGWVAPYSYLSLPVVLGTVGGIGLLIGPAGLLWLKGRADPAVADTRRYGMDAAFIVLLFLTSLTGLVLLVFRSTPAMGTLLAIHLGVVLGLFLSLPYGKFVHAVYRFAALVRYAIERRRPMPTSLEV